MPKYVMKARPTGLINGEPWPEVGKHVDLPEHVAVGMIAAGLIDEAKAERRPAPKKNEERR